MTVADFFANPYMQRIAGTLAAIVCFVTSNCLPQFAYCLIPAGVGLLAWMHTTKPGDAPKDGAQ